MEALLLMLVIMVSIGAAQTGDIPPQYYDYFNEKLLVAVGAVIGFVKVFKNMLPVGGTLAVVLTILVSVVYAVIQFGIGEMGIVYGLVVGALAAASFYITKRIGYAHNPTGDKMTISSLQRKNHVDD